MNPTEPPVIPGAVRVVFASDQPEYIPLVAMVEASGAVHTAWTPSEDERAAIAAGADVHLSLLTFGQPLQPVMLAAGPRPS